jgi:hemoglobin-like flavoprotein
MELAESVKQILAASEVFGELFYEEFFRRCPEAKPLFGDVDMQRQALVVTMTLTTVQQFHDGDYPAVGVYLKHLGGLHDRKAVPVEMYPPWRSAMLKTLSRMHGADWSSELGFEWAAALDRAWSVMIHGQEERRKAKKAFEPE